MSQAPMAIERLSAVTRAKLRSTQILTSLPQIVSELLQNSLDANAHHIDIGVDCEEWSCWVRDDGMGMSKVDMSNFGEELDGGRYRTSKAYELNSLDALSTFGFRGEGLASAADLSCLEISSRTLKSRESWSVIVKGGKRLYNGPSTRWRRESPGTVVCIRDAFYNLPVRRLSHPSATRTMELIRQELETFALVFPYVSFSLENTNKARGNNSTKNHVIRIPKTSSTLSAFHHLYGRALTEHVDQIDLTLGEMKLEGFISLNGAHSKAYQFFYINRHPITTCDLQRTIDSRFSSSSFGKHAFDEAGETDLPRPTIRRSPRKMEKKPVYVLNLTIPPQYIDNCLEPSKSAVQLQDKNAVTTFLSTTIQSFLSRHGFSSQDQPGMSGARNDGSPSPRKRRKFSSGDASYADVNQDSLPLTSLLQGDMDVELPTAPPYILGDDDLYEGDEIIWTDPNTGEVFVVNKRTGNSYPQARHSGGQEQDGDDPHPQNALQRRTLFRPFQAKDPSLGGQLIEKASMPEWIQNALEANQVYPMTESKIPSLSLSSTSTMAMQHLKFSDTQQHDCHGPMRNPPQYFQTGNGCAHPNGLSRRFRKADLRDARIINQVDRKFIACLVHDVDASCDSCDPAYDRDVKEEGRALILIDQHAADERVRVERLLKELCCGFLRFWDDAVNGVRMRVLSPPRPVLLTRHEALRLGTSCEIQEAFQSWGFVFADLSCGASWDSDQGIDGGSTSGYSQVMIRSIPEVISDKLLLGDELRDMIKGFLARLETDSSFTSMRRAEGNGTQAEEDGFFWLKALRWCPRELLDLINSKACRGAIMFNDSLTILQCEKLVQQLSETAFPFQCAHGRPSLVPLANLGDGASLGRRNGSKVQWARLGQ